MVTECPLSATLSLLDFNRMPGAIKVQKYAIEVHGVDLAVGNSTELCGDSPAVFATSPHGVFSYCIKL